MKPQAAELCCSGRGHPHPAAEVVAIQQYTLGGRPVDAVGLAGRGSDGRRRDGSGIAVRRYEAALKGHDWTAIEQLLGPAPDFAFHNVDYGSVQDRHGFLAWARLIGESYPGFAVGFDEVNAVGELAIVRFSERGSDDRLVERRFTGVAGVVILRVVDDRIIDLWSNYDEFGLLHERQQGGRAGLEQD